MLIISSNSGPWSMYSILPSGFPFDLHSHCLSCPIHLCVYFYEITLMFAGSANFEILNYKPECNRVGTVHSHFQIHLPFLSGARHFVHLACVQKCHTQYSLSNKHHHLSLGFQNPMQFLNRPTSFLNRPTSHILTPTLMDFFFPACTIFVGVYAVYAT